MKKIGLIGGMGWESTVTYYQLLNRMARERLGGLHSADLILWSFDFAEIEAHKGLRRDRANGSELPKGIVKEMKCESEHSLVESMFPSAAPPVNAPSALHPVQAVY